MIKLKCVNTLKGQKYNCDGCLFYTTKKGFVETNLMIIESIESYILEVANCKPFYLLTNQSSNLIRFVGR